MVRPLTLGFDADDTLWHNENLFEEMHAAFCELLSAHHDKDTVESILFETEMRNLSLYGYGVKSFTLSAIETAIGLTGETIQAPQIRRIIELGKSILAHPVELLPGVAELIASLSEKHPLVLITKGDLQHQESKIHRSGIAHHFRHAEVVANKDSDTYARLLKRFDIAPENFLMVGNSLKSDIVPILELGGLGVHIPYHLTWAHEEVDEPPQAPGRFFTLDNLAQLPGLLESLSG